jgi:glycosyltransferase involved in cell wall biosynthesis
MPAPPLPPPGPVDLLFVEPWYGGSHRAWIEGFRRHTRCTTAVLGLAPRHWKWRLLGAAGTLAARLRASGLRPKAIVASSMLHLPAFLGHARGAVGDARVHLYLHENQLLHPVSPRDRGPDGDRVPAWINVDSLCAADAVWFNSAWHRDAFFDALPGFLDALPDHRGVEEVAGWRARSGVLPLGLDFPAAPRVEDWPSAEGPILLWNHRWTFDKAPDAWARALIDLAPKRPFRVVLLGPEGSDPALHAWRDRLRDALGVRLLHDGPVDRSAYAEWLGRAHLLPVTARHDFFGLSVVEAIGAGCRPLLPRRLAYPEHLPADAPGHWWYAEDADFPGALDAALSLPPEADAGARLSAARHVRARYAWPAVLPAYAAAWGA